ncbi:hypothetical protein [Variovorax guangxiensis]|uniref:bestrophin-like domain n=1 Tax=Variovorax guangxiensis TaxID=1775474 RepID=UPI0028546569|nr:hypothetical protein [Variovorax guangxiensis]MDR6855157.1 uncharacterized membrane protein YsdA (DUF1294 family) [Variovorax guangxiensis]
MRFLYDIPTPILAVLLFIAMIAIIEGAQRLGRRLDGEKWQHSHDMLIMTTRAMLGLLGLLLAFSFSLSAIRHEARRTLVLKEANSVVSAYLRCDLLAPAARDQMRELLRSYAGLRLQYFEVGHNEAEEQRVIQESQSMQGRLWAMAAGVDNYVEPRSTGLSMLASAIDEMIAISRDRHASRANRVPEPVLWMLFVMVLVSSGAVGYCFGASQQHGHIFAFSFVFLVCLVVYIILDLDRPRRGLMKVDQTPLLELQTTLRR